MDTIITHYIVIGKKEMKLSCDTFDSQQFNKFS